jgi:sulfoxide reductase catalytic subunit YedY
LPDSAPTPQVDYRRRREFLRTVGLALAATAFLPSEGRAATVGFPDSLNTAFKLDGVKLTPYDLVTSYNNFYEWGLAKGAQGARQQGLENRTVDDRNRRSLQQAGQV